MVNDLIAMLFFSLAICYIICLIWNLVVKFIKDEKYKFIKDNRFYELQFKKNYHIKLDFKSRIEEIKDLKSNFKNLQLHELKLLKADVESKLESSYSFTLLPPFIALSVTLITYIIKDPTIQGIPAVFLLIFLFISIIIPVYSVINERCRIMFIKNIIDICIEEKKKPNVIYTVMPSKPNSNRRKKIRRK
ncbi:hypothetical protein ACETAC_01350 [Aceticella autotrophica]|uniref:Uncharacterized protein n=1 Tax=Aceticella autotrophica TaxID=2755338 RepID=A0A975AW59_9THEO|nr:hypothetical protein [Aceticella autotrophica]QSZ27590.1 hypothetical protein ACETAC_01350 [Aceticella autotrophica]